MDAIQVTTVDPDSDLMSEIIVSVVSLGALEGRIVRRRAAEVRGHEHWRMLTSSDDERIRCGLWMPNCSGLQRQQPVFVECINQGTRRILAEGPPYTRPWEVRLVTEGYDWWIVQG